MRTFKILAVRRRTRDRCQRSAVLFPLVDPDHECQETLPGLTTAFNRLLNHRRSRLFALSSAGYAPLQNTHWSMDCPPFSVLTDLRTRVCRQPRWCPFCWARQVTGELYDRVDRAFFLPDEKALGDSAIKLHLVGAEHRMLVPKAESLSRLLSGLKADQAAFRRLLPSRGSYVLTTLEPVPDHWAVHRRVLLIVGPQDTLPTILGPDDKPYAFTRSPRVTREVIGTQVAAITRYPLQLLRGPVDEVATLLRAVQGLRLAANYGVLRNKAGTLTERKRKYDLDH